MARRETRTPQGFNSPTDFPPQFDQSIFPLPRARLELAQGFNSPTDFKSVASADSATWAEGMLSFNAGPLMFQQRTPAIPSCRQENKFLSEIQAGL